ncbi:MAG: hypothetical protein DIZ80_11205 [endosymbiont of Galathealinum brachiosum]|uniref:Lipoprotein n=1 Tax=endosymbiont of Galathealinum brachiosum TaxID=2200906 RepID=A0A370DD38_9GAMM|nr:MAG: hypothetical protein DIZ80_11205 [endosymbiont of Galathealinum brachiosum]
MCKRNYKIIKTKNIIILLSLTLLMSCASYHSYEPDKSKEYKEHWENNEDIKDNLLLYPYSEECKEEKKHGKSCR